MEVENGGGEGHIKSGDEKKISLCLASVNPGMDMNNTISAVQVRSSSFLFLRQAQGAPFYR
jgi:hypothetical protein